MDRQKTYETVRDALLKQGKPSLDHEGNCAYRSANGLKCGIGHLIPDRLYNPAFEGYAVEHILSMSPELSNYLGVKTQEDVNFIEDLQFVHDDHPKDEWEKAFKFLARNYKLKP